MFSHRVQKSLLIPAALANLSPCAAVQAVTSSLHHPGPAPSGPSARCGSPCPASINASPPLPAPASTSFDLERLHSLESHTSRSAQPPCVHCHWSTVTVPCLFPPLGTLVTPSSRYRRTINQPINHSTSIACNNEAASHHLVAKDIEIQSTRSLKKQI